MLAMVMIVRMFMAVVIMLVIIMIVVVMVLRIGCVMFTVVAVIAGGARGIRVLAGRRSCLRGFAACDFNDLALDPLAIAAAARIAMPRTAAMIGTVLAFLFGFAMGALVGLDQCLTIGDRDL